MDEFESREVATFWRFLESSLDSFVQLASGIGDDGLQWKPPAEAANSIAVMLTHTLGNARENVLEILCGEAVNRDRDSEFVDRPVTAESLAEQWSELKARLVAKLSTVPAIELDRVRSHPRRGEIDGRSILIVATRHAAEHLGQAELTRDLWQASHA
ncbi:hypothetical protein BH09CHL1_BH09CHL1_31290 [soil metagenome]